MSIAVKSGIRQQGHGHTSPVLLTCDEMAVLLRTSRIAIYQMVYRDQVPGVVRIGRRLLFRNADVMRWLDQLSSKP